VIVLVTDALQPYVLVTPYVITDVPVVVTAVAVIVMPVVPLSEIAPVLLLLHAPVPPAAVSDKVTGVPNAMLVAPCIAVGVVGVGLTVTVAVVIQPVVILYVIVVVPAATPVTTPDATTVAAVVLLLVHDVDVAVESLNVVVDPLHTVNVPKIADGFLLTVFG
jgi:hypothetical protein